MKKTLIIFVLFFTCNSYTQEKISYFVGNQRVEFTFQIKNIIQNIPHGTFLQ